MELVGLYRNKDNNKTKPFGSKVCGLRCDDILIRPQELLYYFNTCASKNEKPEDTLYRLKRYLITLSHCFHPNSNARNTELPSND